MKESVDKNLKEHIIRVFDNYEDNSAEQGWLELRKKYPEKPSRRIIAWWSSAAAILVIAGSLLFMNKQKENEHTTLAKNTKKEPKEVSKDTSENKISEKPLEKTPKLKKITLSENIISYPVKKEVKTSKTTLPGNDHLKDANSFKLNEPFIASEKEPRADIISLNKILQESSVNSSSEETLLKHKDEPLTQNSTIDNNTPIKESNSFFAEQKSVVLAEVKTPLIEKKEEVQNKKMELSFYAGPFFNYAEGSSNSMNLGAGVSSGISLSKRFTLIAGLALAKNTLVFNSEVPANSYVAFLNSAALDQKSQNLFVSSSVAQISKFEAQLLNLDIPVNIKYSLSREPDKVFVTAGLSSYTYLNEAYRYSYNYLSNGSNAFSSSSTSSDKVINKNFGKFDLAQTLNLSVGLTHTAKVQSFVIEPFIKYPLGTLGSQNIRFGSAGINFKLSIHPTKKHLK